MLEKYYYLGLPPVSPSVLCSSVMLQILCFGLKCLGFEFVSQFVHKLLKSLKWLKSTLWEHFWLHSPFVRNSRHELNPKKQTHTGLSRFEHINLYWNRDSWTLHWSRLGSTKHLNGRCAGMKQESKKYMQAREFRSQLVQWMVEQQTGKDGSVVQSFKTGSRWLSGDESQVCGWTRKQLHPAKGGGEGKHS